MKAIDKLIGSKLLFERKRHGYSQQILATLTDRTFQQIQKYETGYNRIPQGIFVYLAYIWKQDIASFFPDPKELFGSNELITPPTSQENPAKTIDMRTAKTLEALPTNIKKHLKQLIHAIAKEHLVDSETEVLLDNSDSGTV